MLPDPMGVIRIVTKEGKLDARGIFVGPYRNEKGECFDKVVARFQLIDDQARSAPKHFVWLVMGPDREEGNDTAWAVRCLGAVAPHILAAYVDSSGNLPMVQDKVVDVDKWLEGSAAATASNTDLAAVLDGGLANHRRLCREDVLHILLEHYDAVGPRDGLTVEQILASPLKRRFYDEVIANNIIQTLNAELLVFAMPGGAQRIYSWWVNPEKAAEVRQEVSAFKARAAAHASASRPDGSLRLYDAFLCHASEDKAGIVLPFAEAMTEQGLKPWLDAGEVRWGDNLVAKINHGLTKSKCVVVFISPAFLGKKWPETELNAALSLEVNGRAVVLPLLCGITHEQLQQAYPLVASKVYKEFPVSAGGAQPSDVAPLVSELKAIVQTA